LVRAQILFFYLVERYARNATNRDLALIISLEGLLGVTACAQSIDLALSTKGRLKVGENTLPPVYNEPGPKHDGCSSSGILPPWALDAFDTIFSLRGIGWRFGRHIYVPVDHKPIAQRPVFLALTVFEFIFYYLVADLLITLIQLLPGIGSTAGGSIFYADLPLVPRYALSTAITLVAGAAMTSGFEALYALATLVGVIIFKQPETAWPPLIDNPFAADSIADFWARRWHQVLRRTFMVMGGIPGGWIAGRAGVVMGTFLASGIFHELGAYAIGRGIDHRVTLFFTLQGVAVILEGLWQKTTGHRVQGWGGRIWAYLVMLPLAQMCCKYSALA
jgi:hypothetical protein